MDDIDLVEEFSNPVQTLKAVPNCIRASHARMLTQCLARIRQTQQAMHHTARSHHDVERRQRVC